jgi:hypothetical protein
MTCIDTRSCRRASGRAATAFLFSLAFGLLAADDSLGANDSPGADENLPGYREFAFALPAATERMLVVDADGDGLRDLMTFAENTVSLYFQTADGFDFTAPGTQVELPGEAVGWDISNNYSINYSTTAASDGAYALIALIDGNRVLCWQIQDRQFIEAAPLLTGLTGSLGHGVYRLNFSRDINDDGLEDLIVPGAGQLALHIRNNDDSYQQPLAISSDMQLRTVLYPDNPRSQAVTGSDDGRQQPIDLTREVGQSLRIPLLALRDVNGDDSADLISDTDERFDVFLANPGPNDDYFSTAPSYSIDRTAIRERLGDFDVDRLDFANLTGVLALTHEELLQDMNGDGIDDMILREGGRVALHLGSADGINLEQADQILRSGGNVLNVFLHDENGDEKPDLWLWRVEQISLGDVFLWLAISGTINIEAFVYPNEGEAFARRPARRITVALRFPSAVRMISSVQEVRDRASSSEAVIPTTRALLSTGQPGTATAGVAMDDLLVLLDNQIDVFYRALAPEPNADEGRFLASINYERGRDDYEIDVRRIIDEFDIEINRDLNTVSQRQPDIRLPLAAEAQRGDIAVTDLNNNGIDDIFVFIERSRDAVIGVLWLSDTE